MGVLVQITLCFGANQVMGAFGGTHWGKATIAHTLLGRPRALISLSTATPAYLIERLNLRVPPRPWSHSIEFLQKLLATRLALLVHVLQVGEDHLLLHRRITATGAMA